MSETSLSRTNEDYLKNIWLLKERTGKTAGVRALAKRMNLSASTVSEAIKKLTSQGYVEHHRYGGVTLTALGSEIAVQIVRKHRLIETFLVSELGYTWEAVHAEAEALEHAVSQYFIDRIDEILKHPFTDPHGDPIPDADGFIRTRPLKLLSEISFSDHFEIARVSDENPEILAFLADNRLLPGAKCSIKDISPSLGLITLKTDSHSDLGSEVQITFSVAKHIWVFDPQ